jgi:two-component system, NtrC family, response regulator AtoC
MGQRILVADDDLATLDGLRALLAAWGFEVQTATDGREALERVSTVPPSLVITDLIMPTMGGLELLTALHQHQPRLPVIVITGQGDVETLHTATRKGAYGYLKKPVDVQRLRTLLESALERTALHPNERPNGIGD